MEGGDKKELARKMAQQRAQASAGAGRKPLGGQAPKQQSGSLFNVGEAGGWSMSPKTILLFSVAYMGCVILLHIFGKVTSIKGKAAAAEGADATGGGEGASADL